LNKSPEIHDFCLPPHAAPPALITPRHPESIERFDDSTGDLPIGLKNCNGRGSMARSTDLLDRRPGSMPEISMDGDSIVFECTVMSDRSIPPGARLLVRCDPNGNVFVRLVKGQRPAKNS